MTMYYIAFSCYKWDRDEKELQFKEESRTWLVLVKVVHSGEITKRKTFPVVEWENQ